MTQIGKLEKLSYKLSEFFETTSLKSTRNREKKKKRGGGGTGVRDIGSK